MPQIAALNFKFLTGLPEPGGMNLDEITRANADGVALREIGKRGGPVELVSFVDVAANAVQSTIESYHALRGTLVSIVDEFNNTWSNVAVLKVSVSQAKKVGTVIGGINSGTVILEARWTVQSTAIPGT
jgi:hypothetical protein